MKTLVFVGAGGKERATKTIGNAIAMSDPLGHVFSTTQKKTWVSEQTAVDMNLHAECDAVEHGEEGAV